MTGLLNRWRKIHLCDFQDELRVFQFQSDHSDFGLENEHGYVLEVSVRMSIEMQSLLASATFMVDQLLLLITFKELFIL
jgi:hypothetical protein